MNKIYIFVTICLMFLLSSCSSNNNEEELANNISIVANASENFDEGFPPTGDVYIISSFTTKFNAKQKSRVNNLALAAKAVSGVVLQPGQEFSFNETVGPSTKARGYKKAKILIKGREAYNYGGGICQVSSTLYNAADNAGLEIIERHSHSKKVAYVKKNRDAATSHGGVDFKFRNSFPFEIMLNAYINENEITTDILRPIVYG